MADGKLQKVEKDFAPILDAELPKIEATARNGNLRDALDQLLVYEKQTRGAADLASTSRLLCLIVKLCFEAKDWKALNEHVVILSKKHGQLKQAISKMVNQAIEYLEKTPNIETKLELIDTLRTVTEGKIYVEVERARLTRTLSNHKEKEGKIKEAAQILQELQVETYGSMEKREKTEFILEQMRLLLAVEDFTRTLIISRKISTKFFKEEQNQDLKLRFYHLMIKYAIHHDEYLNACKYWREVYDTAETKADEKKWKEALQNAVCYIALAPYDNEQSDLIHRIAIDPKLPQLDAFHNLIQIFTKSDLTRWPILEQLYGGALKQTKAFSATEPKGTQRWQELHKRVVEHNVRIIAKYYTRITFKRITQLLDLPAQEVEDVISKLVVSKVVYAKMDRPTGIITFAAPKDPNEILNEYSTNIGSLLELVDKCNHLITKEEMVGSITKVM